MNVRDAEHKIQELKERHKTLTARREQIIREAAVEEARLEQAYESLRQRGIDNPESLTNEQLDALLQKYRSELAAGLATLEQQISEGERLMGGLNVER